MPLLVAGASGGCATGSSTLPTSPSPAARAGHILTYDALEGRVRLFGGFSGATSFGEVWEVVQGRWVRVSTDAPLLDRTWPTLAFDAYHRIHVLFGGKTMDRVPYGDTWLFDVKNWRPHAGPGPAARSHHTAVFDPSRRVIVLFGGDDNGHLFRDTWEWSEKVRPQP